MIMCARKHELGDRGWLGNSGRWVRVAVVATVLAGALTGVAPAQPSNDECGTPVAIATLPFAFAVDTTTATSGIGDPTLSCVYGASSSVWFTFTALTDTVLTLDTAGSGYATALGVFTGACGALSEIACHADDRGGGLATVTLALSAGQSVLIDVVDTAGAGGGNLVLHADRSNGLAGLGLVAASGDASPLGGTFAEVVSPALENAKDVLFTGVSAGVFVRRGGILETIAVSGDPSPIGGAFSIFGAPAVSATGAVAFWAMTDGPTATSAIFLWTSASGIVPLLAVGDVLVPGGAIRSFRRDVVINAIGDVAFVAQTTFDPGEILALKPLGAPPVGMAFESDPNPCGGTMNGFARTSPPGFALNDLGELAFQVSGSGSVGDGIFVTSYPGAYVPLACEGDASPIGGSFDFFGRQPALNNLGDVVFMADVDLPGRDQEGLFFAPAGGPLSVIAKRDDLTASGERLTDFNRSLVPAVNDAGAVAFAPTVSPGGRSLVLASLSGGPPTLAATPGDACPGGVLGSIGLYVALAQSGDAAFVSSCAGETGVFSLPSSGGVADVARITDATAIGAGFSFGRPSVNDASDVGFIGTRTGVFTRRCEGAGCGAVVASVAPLDPIQGLPGEFVEGIVQLAGSGREAAILVFSGGAKRRQVLLQRRHGALEKVAAEGDVPEGSVDPILTFQGVDVFASTGSMLAVDGGGIAFLASVSSGQAIFVVKNGVARTIARTGDPAPGGGTFGSSFSSPSIGGSKVAFVADPAGPDCVFLAQSFRVLQRVACAGDPAPGSVGGTIGTLHSKPLVVGARVVFVADIVDGAGSRCVIGVAGSTPRVEACDGVSLETGATIADFRSAGDEYLLAGSGSRVVASVGTSLGSTGLVAFRRGVATSVAMDDGSIASPLGGRFSFFDTGGAVAMRGTRVVFQSTVSDGLRRSGIFLATLRR